MNQIRRIRKFSLFAASSLTAVVLAGCGGGMSASDQKICEFVGTYTSELIVPTDTNELARYMELSPQEKFEVRREDRWYVHDQWEKNEETAKGLQLMADGDTDSEISLLLNSIVNTLDPVTSNGEGYMIADIPNEAQQALLTKVLEAERNVTQMYRDLSLRCVEMSK